MRALLIKLAKLQTEISKALNRIPIWPDIVAWSARICAPVVGLAKGVLLRLPFLRKLEWLLEIESLTTRHPVLLAFSMTYVVWRGLHTTSLGHIGTDPMIYPFLGAVSGFNPFLGLVCGALFGIADLTQKLIWPDMYGAKGWFDLNYWGAMVGYVVAYSSVMIMGVFPGMLSRVFRAIVMRIIRKLFFDRAAAAADGAVPDKGGFVLAEVIAGCAGGFAGGYLTMAKVAPVTEMPAFLWRPNPDISCHRLEVGTHLVGRAPIGAVASTIGSVLPLIPPPESDTTEQLPPSNEDDSDTTVTTDEEATDEEATDEEATDEEATDEEATDEEATDEEATDEEATDEEATDEEVTDEEVTDEEATDEEVPVAEAPVEVSPYGPEYDQALQEKKDAEAELEQIKNQLAESELTADKSDPNYENVKQQYTDYMDYLTNKAAAADAQANAIAQDAITKANTRVLHGTDGRDYTIVLDPTTGIWHNSETGNEFDPDKFDQWQADLVKDKEFSANELDKMSTRQDAFSQEMDQMVANQKAQDAEIHELTRIAKATREHDLWNPGGPGDVHGKTQALLDAIYSGKPIDEKDIAQVRKIVEDRITGKTADASILSNPENQDSVLDAIKKAGSASLETILTGKDADGNMSLTALGARLVAGVATAGASEAVYIGANVIYSAKDAIDQGATDRDAFKAGAKTGAVEGLFILAGHLVPAAGAKFFPKVTAGVGEMLEPVGKAVAAADSAVQKGSKALATRISKIFNPVPESLTGTRAAVTKVLESGSSSDLAKLYSQDGMKKLAELQKAGHLSAEEAKILNSRLSSQVNQDIDKAVKKTIDNFEKRTSVRVEESVLGDSGSSARPGGNPKAKTDFDKTSVTKFNKVDVENYARKNAISMEEANRELQAEFSEKLTNNVDNHLRSSGFARGVEDIDYKTYTGIGKSAGQADAYSAGYTGARQVQGTGMSYGRGVDGSIKSHKISGQAVVDQHGLNTLKRTGELPTDPTKFHAGEFRDFSAQQVKSVAEHTDVKSLAKAMGRQSELAGRLESLANSSNPTHANELYQAAMPTTPPLMTKKVVEVSKMINSNPSKASDILAANGFNETSYATAVRSNVNNFHNGLGVKDVNETVKKAVEAMKSTIK